MARRPGAVRERRGPWFAIAIAVIRPTLVLLTRRRRRGLEHIPVTGGALLVANHLSIVDPLTIAHAVYDAGRLPHYLAKDSLFRMPVVGAIMRGARQIPVRRYTTDAGQALSAAVEALREGRTVIIYPEGTTSRDPDLWPMRSHTGVARLALATDVPVLPLAHWGPQHIYRRGGHPHPFARPEVHTVVGPPVDLSGYAGRPQTPALLREVTDLLMGKVTDLVAEIRGEQPPAQPYTWRRGPATPAAAGDDDAAERSA